MTKHALRGTFICGGYIFSSSIFKPQDGAIGTMPQKAMPSYQQDCLRCVPNKKPSVTLAVNVY